MKALVVGLDSASPYLINGFMVSGFPVPPRKVWSYPKALMKRLDNAVGTYEVDVPLAKPSELKGGENEFLAQVERLHTKSVQAAKLLIQWYKPDVFVMTFQAIDRVHHDFWKYTDDESSQYRNVLHDWYQRVDAAVGELCQLAGPETHILALSDHGSTGVSSAFYINEYLERSGLLTLRERIRRKGETYAKLRRTMLKVVPPSFIARAYKIMPSFISRNFTGFASIDRILEGIIDNVDWDKTLAYSTGGHQAHIYVNYNLVKQNSSQEGIMHITTVVAKVHVNPRVGTKSLWSFSPHYSSIHTREGFWMLAGPQIKRGVQLDASILDMAPTLLRLLHVEAGKDFDGKVLDSIFEKAEERYQALEITSHVTAGNHAGLEKSA